MPIFADPHIFLSSPTSCFSVFLTLFISLSPSFPQTATYWHVLQHTDKCVVSAFPSSVSPGTLLNDLVPWLFFYFFLSPLFSITNTYVPVAVYVPERPTFTTFNDPAHRLLFSHSHTSSLLSEGKTTNDNYVRIKRSTLRCNLNAFLGSALSVSALFPWLPVKSFVCLFVATFFYFVFPNMSFMWNRAATCVR